MTYLSSQRLRGRDKDLDSSWASIYTCPESISSIMNNIGNVLEYDGMSD